MSDLNAEIALWLSKAMTPNQVFAPKPMPVDLYDNNEAVRAARLLEGKAEALAAIHEGRAFDGREPFTDEDYAAFSAAHKDLAEGHRMLGEELKANRPDALQAISAHGDAMALHNSAARLAEMRLPSQELGERNLMWPHMESNQFRFGRKAPWDTEEKNWRKAHQAFIASQLAAQKTAFDTGVVEKGGPNPPEPIGHLIDPGGHYRGPRTFTPEMHERNGDRAVELAQKMQAAAQEARDAGDKERAVKMHDGASVTMQRAVVSYRNAGHAEKEASTKEALGAHTVGDFPGHPFRGNQYTKSVDDVVEKGMDESLADILRHDEGHDRWHEMNGDAPCTSEADCAAKRAKYAEVKAEEADKVQKGDVPGHVFHGNQYVDGTSSIPDNVGHRDFDPNTTLSQIGKMNILAVSGGKVNAIHNIDGAAVGVELPVSSGYKVRVFLRDDDTYTVQRVNKDSVKGEETGVFADQVGESVYQAGMYKSNPFGGHTPR